jgi:hypothetical protein
LLVVVSVKAMVSLNVMPCSLLDRSLKTGILSVHSLSYMM